MFSLLSENIMKKNVKIEDAELVFFVVRICLKKPCGCLAPCKDFIHVHVATIEDTKYIWRRLN
jgi:hypothetical protein